LNFFFIAERPFAPQCWIKDVGLELVELGLKMLCKRAALCKLDLVLLR